MLTLRLFHVANPFRPIETRTFCSAEVTIGRDPAADWRIEDAACELSRRHCVISIKEGRMRVKDTSANGVFVGDARRRLGQNQEADLLPGQTIYIGPYMIAVEPDPKPASDSLAEDSPDGPSISPILREPELSAAAFEVRSAWRGAPAKAGDDRARLPDAALLEAFCEGAGLDPSTFMSEDPKDVMRRAGAIYRQAVLGLSDLLGERTALKTAYWMDRTRVTAADNNPLKWADAHGVAVDLLKSPNGPFLTGAQAVNNSFQDLKKHLLCLMAASRSAVSAVLEELSPEGVEQAAAPGLFERKADVCWRRYRNRHEAVSADARENRDSAINRAFKSGYERHVRKLDGSDVSL